MSPSLRVIGYVSLLGPPRAIFLHAQAKGTGSELDGVPLWLAVAAELIIRGVIYVLTIFLLQEIMGRQDFHRYQMSYFATGLGVAGICHTLIYFLTLGWGVSHWQLSSMQRAYRLGRNLTYSVAPTLATMIGVLWWQDMNHIPLFQGQLFWQIPSFVGLVFVALGILEAVFVKRVPTGLEADVQVLTSRNQK